MITIYYYYGQYYQISPDLWGVIRYTHRFNTTTLAVEVQESEHTRATESEIKLLNLVYSYPAYSPFHSACLPDTTTKRSYYHNGSGGFTYIDAFNSSDCGWLEGFVDKMYYSQNPIWHSVQGPANTLVELELWTETEHYLGDFRKVITLAKVTGSDGNCHFRLDQILHKLLQVEMPAAIVAACKTSILNYYVRFRIGEQNWQKSYLNTVLLGGLPVEAEGVHDLTNSFLTWQPAKKKINPVQPEYLYWLNRGEAATFKVRKGNYAAGIDIPAYEYTELEVKKHQLVCIPVFGVFGLAGAKLDVCLMDATNAPITGTHLYLADEVRGEEAIFLFANSLGGWDTLRCTGEREVTADTKEEIGEVEQQPGAGRKAQRILISSMASRTIRQSTGPNPGWRQEYLQEFVFSRARFEYDSLRRLLPIVLVKKGLSISSRANRQGYTFEYEYAFQQIGYAEYN